MDKMEDNGMNCYLKRLLKQRDFFIGQLTPFAGRQIVRQCQRPDRLAVQAFNVIAERGKHTLDLVVAPFGDGKLSALGREKTQYRRVGRRLFAIKLNTPAICLSVTTWR